MHTSHTFLIFLYDSENCDALRWWSVHSAMFPMVFWLAMNYLAVMPSEAPCERGFAVFGDVIKRKRNRLDVDHACRLVFLKKNLDAQAKDA